LKKNPQKQAIENGSWFGVLEYIHEKPEQARELKINR
jgi:hypothetical protein